MFAVCKVLPVQIVTKLAFEQLLVLVELTPAQCLLVIGKLKGLQSPSDLCILHTRWKCNHASEELSGQLFKTTFACFAKMPLNSRRKFINVLPDLKKSWS